MNNEFAEIDFRRSSCFLCRKSSLRDWQWEVSKCESFSMMDVQGSRAFPAESRVRVATTGKSSRRYPHPSSTSFSHGAFIFPVSLSSLNACKTTSALRWSGIAELGCIWNRPASLWTALCTTQPRQLGAKGNLFRTLRFRTAFTRRFFFSSSSLHCVVSTSTLHFP